MRTRTFGRTGRTVSELGVGMWGMGGGIGGWTGADDRQSVAVLQAAVDAGVTFFDSAQVYGAGHSDQLLGALARANPGRDLFLASKIPPKSREWPARPGDRIRDAFPPDHIRSSVEGILRQMRMDSLDLVQFHVWQDEWADDEGWQLAADRLKRDGLVGLVGISVNRREPANVLRTLRTGRIDAVQVVYNIFDQAPEDELFPLCRELGVEVIARVPLDEGIWPTRSRSSAAGPRPTGGTATSAGPTSRQRFPGSKDSDRSCSRARRWPSWRSASSSPALT